MQAKLLICYCLQYLKLQDFGISEISRSKQFSGITKGCFSGRSRSAALRCDAALRSLMLPCSSAVNTSDDVRSPLTLTLVAGTLGSPCVTKQSCDNHLAKRAYIYIQNKFFSEYLALSYTWAVLKNGRIATFRTIMISYGDLCNCNFC